MKSAGISVTSTPVFLKCLFLCFEKAPMMLYADYAVCNLIALLSYMRGRCSMATGVSSRDHRVRLNFKKHIMN